MGKSSKKQPHRTDTQPQPEVRWKRIPNQVKNKLNPLVVKLLNRCIDVTANSGKTVSGYKDVFEILQEIQHLEKDFTRPAVKREDNWDGFFEWCKEHGGEFSGISVKEINESNFGMVAEKDMKETDIFLTMPRKLMLSINDARSSKLGPLIEEDKILQSMPNVTLSLFLILETLNKNSFWAPYLSILPSSYDTVLYFNLEELEMLQRSPVTEKVINTCQSVARQYAYFCLMFQRNEYAKSLDIGPCFTYDLYRWAVSTIMTRQNAVPTKDGSSDITVLIPMWDMCNHKNGKFATDFNVTKDYLESYAMQDFNKGDEVFIFYGPRSNSDFFIHNAFVYPPNENDFIELKLNISKSDPLASQKVDLCSKKNVKSNGAFQLPVGGVVGDELMTFLKIYVMKEGEVGEATEGESMFDGSTEKGKEIECRAFNFIKDRANLLLRSYGTSIEDDEKALESANSHRRKMTIMLRLCEKKILNDCINYCETALKV